MFPRGQSYEIGNFVLSSELENAFGSTNGIFTVPCLSNFVKIATDGIYENHEFLTKHPGRNSVPEHRHTMTNASNSEIDISVEEDKIDPNIIWNTLHSNGCSNSHGTIPHHGKKSKKQDIYNTGFEMDLPDTFKIHADNIQSGKYGSSYSEANEATTETYPTYTNLPVMIYIGPSIYSIGK